jgi:hypothetical protein
MLSSRLNNFLKKTLRGAFFFCLVAAALPNTLGVAQTSTTVDPATKKIKVGPDRRVQVYKLESVELSGTTRMTVEDVVEELGLATGTPLDDDLVMSTRVRLLSLGLFKSAILIMRKGSRPGLARLIIEVEDDDGVLSDWAVGGDLGVTVTETDASHSATDTAPLGYRLGLVGRNIANGLHRGSLMIDIDSAGEYREGQIAYGLPRFAKEDAQFDAEIASVDVGHRYLNAMGFGARGQGLWSQSWKDFGAVQYGAAMYVNKTPRFAVPGFPLSVAGPKFAYHQESRLRGFFPGPGHLLGASLLFAPMQTENSVFEFAAAKTWGLADDYLFFTMDARVLTVGVQGSSVRSEARFDVPITSVNPDDDQAEVFLRLRGGSDVINKTRLNGSAAILGVRYHSSGFIAELALKITRSPAEIVDEEISSSGGGE